MKIIKGLYPASVTPYKENIMLKLIDVNLSSNLLSPGDRLFITANWQNTGPAGIKQELFPFIDLEFGYQRIPEDFFKKSRVTGEYEPQLTQSVENEIIPVTLSYQVPQGNHWGGTYDLYIGFCDTEGTPVQIIGENEKASVRQFIGCVDMSWGWGRAHIDLIKEPYIKRFNEAEPYASTIEKQHETIKINDKIEVFLRKDSPVITGYSCKDFKTKFSPMLPEILVRSYPADSLFYSFMDNVTVKYELKNVTGNSALYECVFDVASEKAALFEIKFEVLKNTVFISVESFNEFNSFELIEIRYYDLAKLGGDAKMADLIGGGREVNLQNTRNIRYTKNYDIHNSAALYNDKGMVILEDFCLDNKIHTAVKGYAANKNLSIGLTIALRVKAAEKVKSISVPRSVVEVSVFTNEYGKPGWLSFCKYLRRDLKGINRELYSKSLHYVIYASQGPEPFPWQVNEDSPYEIARLSKAIRFSDIINEVKKLYNITDGYRQIPFIYGFHKQSENYKLHWDVYTADHRAGTLEEFTKAINDARNYNTELALYENYDDVYSPTVGMEYAAFDHTGQPWKGWIWADGESKAVSFRKYYESGEMAERIRKMVEIYGERKTGYIDVLSSEVLRWDFNPENPSSAQTSLEYKKKFVDLYNKHGMDVFSETLVHPYVGKIGYAVSTRTNTRTVYYENESFFPMMNGIYHGTIGYCYSDAKRRTDMLKGLLIAGTCRFEIDEPVSYDIVKWIYLHQMPMGMIEDEYLEDYSGEKGRFELRYTNDSHIIIDENNLEYEVMYKGVVVAKNWTTFIPGTKGDGYLAYSLKGGEMEYKFPGEIEIIHAKILSFENDQEDFKSYKTVNGSIMIDMPADKPVKFTTYRKG